MIRIYVDADASPVKNEVLRVAGRYKLKVTFVSNSRIRIQEDESVEVILVKGHPDAADDWIAEHITCRDIAVSADIPLVSRCLDKGARVLDPKGRIFTEDSIGGTLAQRDLMTFLRDQGNMIGGQPPYGKQDRSRFLQRLDDLVQALLREDRDTEGG